MFFKNSILKCYNFLMIFLTFVFVFILNLENNVNCSELLINKNKKIDSVPPSNINRFNYDNNRINSKGNEYLIDFEDGVDGHIIQSGIQGLLFSTTDRQDWLYGDMSTGDYNTDYICNGNIFGWLGPNQGRGRIDFTRGAAKSVTLKYSSESIVFLEAYSADGKLLDSDNGSGNLRQSMGSLSVSAQSIAYVIFHDSGNRWLIDDVVVEFANA